MNAASLHQNPPCEVLLRIRLSEGLNADDLQQLSREAQRTGSMDSALIKVLRAGLAVLNPIRRPAKPTKGGKR